MKFRFQPTETSYLNDKMNQLQLVMTRRDLADGLVRTIQKVKKKFGPGSFDVYLNLKERALLLELLSYRQGQLIKANQVTDEIETIQTIMDKVSIGSNQK
jgi:hypothetical protein